MLIKTSHGVADGNLSPTNFHFSFCTNVFPSETFAEVMQALRENIPRIKESLQQKGIICANDSFGIGLRLSSQACDTLCSEPQALQGLRSWLQRENCYIFSVNGFPYGNFSHHIVKEQVYSPDWSTSRRLEYTVQLARLLAELLPPTLGFGSISTLPLGYKFNLQNEAQQDVQPSFGGPFAIACVSNLAKLVKALAQINTHSGKLIRVGLEPEPDCVLGSIQEAALFWLELQRPGKLRDLCCEVIGVNWENAWHLMQMHLGICIDTCHAAVEFEEAVDALRLLGECKMPIVKVQISSGLKLQISSGLKLKISSGLKLNTGFHSLETLAQFAESRFLHQVKIKHLELNGGVTFSRFRDLSLALLEPPQDACEWRVHFHTPLFFERLGELQGTADLAMEFMNEILKEPSRWGSVPFSELHTEIETYTFEVLPKELRQFQLAELVSKELEWVYFQLAKQKRLLAHNSRVIDGSDHSL